MTLDSKLMLLYLYRNTACPNCKVHFPTCVATGLSIVGASIWFCKICKHPAVQRKMELLYACPLCHAKHDRL